MSFVLICLIFNKECFKLLSGCDVSWISDYPEECEVLISRSGISGLMKKIEQNQFKAEIEYEGNIQIVHIKPLKTNTRLTNEEFYKLLNNETEMYNTNQT